MGDESEMGAKLLVKRKPRTGFGSREVDPLGVMVGETVDVENCTRGGRWSRGTMAAN